MNKFILILFLSLGFHSNSFSQNGWFWQNPLPNGNTLNFVKFVNAQTGFAVGNIGTILKTVNGGENWNLYYSNFLNDIYSLAYINDNTIYAVGTDGLVIKTTNSGIVWERLSIGTNDSLNAIYFFNSSTGYIVGNRGKIYKTTDGGNNWFEQMSGTTSKLNNAYFINPDKGFICGDFKLLRTTNGGNNWSVSDFGSIFNSISFINDNTGFMAGGISSSIRDLRRTTNGGNTWLTVTVPSTPILNEIQFINSLTGFISLNGNSFFKTTNGGNNWSLSVNMQSEINSSSLFFLNQNEGFLVGTFGTVFKTFNSGSNWTLKSPVGILDDFSEISFSSMNTGYVMGRSIHKTTNGGISWTDLSFPYPFNFYLNFLNDNTGYVEVYSQEHYVLLKTEDGGLSWDSLRGSNDIDLLYQFLDANTGFFTYFADELIKTTNGGDNWTNYSFFPRYVHGLQFPLHDIGYILLFNDSLQLFKTSNTGENWSYINNIQFFPKGSMTDTKTLNFIDENTGFMSSNYETSNFLNYNFNKTTNGGISWFQVYSILLDVDFFLTSSLKLKFINNETGFIMGLHDKIFKTTDQGENWFEYYISNRYLRDIEFTDGNTGYVVGAGGLIKKTTNGGTVEIENISSFVSYGFMLDQNYPNPFNPITKIKYELPASNYVTLKVYNILGKEIISLVNEKQNAGRYEAEFNGENLPSGIYFYKISANNFTQSRKMILLK